MYKKGSSDQAVEIQGAKAAKAEAAQLAQADPETRTFNIEAYTAISLTPEEIEKAQGGEEGKKRRLQLLGILPLSTR